MYKRVKKELSKILIAAHRLDTADYAIQFAKKVPISSSCDNYSSFIFLPQHLKIKKKE